MARKWAVNQTKRVKTPLVRETQDLEITIALIYNYFTILCFSEALRIPESVGTNLHSIMKR